ncbi:MAG: hypothetical protein FJ098_16735, partial [Deltaproteobacteria bacterium]|nr:hypothetical protein [Deltaproteobacteria bacterium]
QELAWDYAGQGTLSPTWHSLSLTTLEGYPFWQLVTDGVVRTVPLPSFTGLLGVNLIPQGDKRLTVTGAASPGFDIDNFRNVDMGTGDRESWAIDMVLFK